MRTKIHSLSSLLKIIAQALISAQNFCSRDVFDVKIDPGRFESVDVVVVEGILGKNLYLLRTN